MLGSTYTEDEIVDGFFDAALNPDLWAENLAKLSDFVGGAAINLIMIDKPGSIPVDMHYECVDEFAYTSYVTDYIAVDPRIERIIKAPINTILLEDDVLTADEKKNGAIYNELLSVSGMRNQAISLLSGDTLYAGFGVAPRNDANPFDADQLARLRRLLPHLRHAVRLYSGNLDLQIQRNALGDLWSRSGKGVVILNDQRKLLFANETSENYLRDGLLRHGKDGLVFRDRASQARWQEALARLMREDVRTSTEFLAVDPVTLETYGVRLTTARAALSCFSILKAPAIVMLITPLSDGAVIGENEVSRFCELFGITAAESRVVASIASGISLDQHALMAGIALDTARKQLKSAMAKAGVANQKAFVSRLERFCFLSGA
ncbi:helix-turn-helix transcriptional regulator [Roseibium sp.]|uniref:helix-turn-helix transcriptional regulator n=1 Tax=Roseibium sp. TaxID=1936156 RepID=UPI003A9808CC